MYSKDGGSNGISKFNYDDINNTPFIDVPVNTLDSFELTDINFIKIDVEGHEQQVLEGSIKTITENDYPKILFESWDEHHEKEGHPSIQIQTDLFDFIKSLEYKIVKVGLDMYVAER